MKRVGLGRGLDALFANEDSGTGSMREIPVDLLQRGRYQPRGIIAESSLQELAESIRHQGVCNPSWCAPWGVVAMKLLLASGAGVPHNWRV
jgi:Predicted transcriptional regulators